MKKQNGFISSSSSVSICYTNRTTAWDTVSTQIRTEVATYGSSTTSYSTVSNSWSTTSTGAPYTTYTNLRRLKYLEA